MIAPDYRADIHRIADSLRSARLPRSITDGCSSVVCKSAAVDLSTAGKQELDAAEDKVQILVKQRDGSLKREPFLTEKPV